MNEKINTKIPNVMFQKIKEYSNEEKDTRYIKAKIWIMHTKQNYNNSYFSKESIEEAIPSIYNTPILTYIEKNKDGEMDASDHRQVLEKDENGDFQYVCKERCIGVIPESSEIKFEERLCDDGICREYLTCTGLIWTKWNDVNDLFEKQNVKSQSMELDPESLVYHFEQDGYCHIDSFKFFGATVLGKYVEPAMKNSTIEVQFSKADAKSIAEEVEARINEFNKYFSKKEEKDSMEDNKEKILDNSVEEQPADNVETNNSTQETEVEVPTDNSKENEKVETEEACEDKKKTKCEKEDSEVKTDNSKSEQEPEANVEDNACGKKKKYSINFELSHDDIRCKLYDKLYELEAIENTWYGICDVYDNHFNYIDYATGQFYTQQFSKTEEEVNFVGERKEVYNVMVDKETYDQIKNVSYSSLQKELAEAKASLERFAKENSELTQFKNNSLEEKRKSEIDSVIFNFTKKLSDETLAEYKKNYYENGKSSEELNNDLLIALGKLNYSKETKVEDNKAELNYTASLENQNECPYKGLESLFN